jgi:ABC-type hemin transport system substrate-binding protein
MPRTRLKPAVFLLPLFALVIICAPARGKSVSPQRVVSLVPAVTTEMIVAMGAGVALAGFAEGVSTHPDQGP